MKKMPNLNGKFIISTAGITLLFLLLLPNSKAVRIPSRFFYENEPHNAEIQLDNETTQDEDTTNSSSTNLNLLSENGREEIPLEFHSKLDDVSGTEEFIDLFVPKDTIDPQFDILGKNMKRNVERAAAVIPKPANCMPENTTVPLTPLNPSKDSKIIYYPKCTRVQRCGGCCNSDLMSCQPIETEYLNFAVTKYRYGEKTPLRGKEIVVVEQHNRCRCACRIKAEHCNTYQEYHPELCRCICTNDDAKEKCLSQDHKIWDEQACRCVCLNIQSCTTGTLFDESQCKCIDPLNKNTGPSLEDRRRFIIKAVAVDPDNSTIYDAV